ncbi:MAG TPA: DNA helicase UvrD, partial [Gammaproteobacteria bacterium]|nr:DNA helicase UvrD [Gammaproteobacteria bacterium]
KSVKAREKKIGEQGEADFLEICQDLVQQLITINEQRLKHHIFHLSSAWYTVGHRLISRYQKLKQEQRLLDFTDLEWNTYQLLNHSDNALWIQYKLDQRIDHLLIDEFQDTNPTQWRLILPLLEEFANVEDKSRSVFIVGDEKQSIYGFRRADPRLLKQAGEWLQENLQAKTFPMDKSRRSSPAIMQLLNSLFQIPYFEKRLPGFHEHATYLDNMPGEITLLPLIEKIDPSEQAIYFRNPLAQALPRQDQPYFREGQQIASHITQLIQQQKLIRTDNGQRPITYADIMLLIRSRTHVAEYERAFREARLPYLSNNKGTLFECQEIQDLLALMEVLYTPQNNLALATVLRSPIFQCNNEDLIMLASGEKHATSFQTGQQFVEKNTCSHRLAQAINHLTRWKTLSGHLPIHDLLDLIFHEINIFQQYLKNIPDHYKRRVQANLNQFLSLALEIESGRYPSIGRFIGKIRYMMQNDESPDEASDNSSNEQHHGVVRILTIHASKGLEAPVIFMADTADVKKDANNSYHALIQWPEHEEKPTEFILCPKKNEQTEGIKTLLQNETNKREIEDANLLYVALTRARQALYISGCQSSSKINKPSWYQLIKDHWPALHATLPQNKKTVSEKH